MTELILTLLVVAVAVNSLVGARFDIDSQRLKAETYGATYVLTRFAMSLTMLGLWVWLAVETGHWQFAALIAIPMLITVGAIASRKQVAR